MLSDSCHKAICDLLNTITEYDYSDQYRDKLIQIIILFDDIRASLDYCEDDPQRHLREASAMREKVNTFANLLYDNSVRKRDNDDVCHWEGIDDLN